MANLKTSINFGLVYIPVVLHNCIKANDIGFNMLYKKTGERIKYKKTCDNCPANLSPDDIVKGYQYEKDKYVVLTNKELEKIKTQKDKSINITEFVKLSEIDPIYYEKSYYVEPTGADNAYALLVKALEDEKKVGIAKTVLGTKENVIALRVINGQLIISTLHFYDEVQKSPVKNIDININKQELLLAKNIVNNMSAKFEPEKFENEYRNKIMKAIEEKIAGQTVKGPKEKKQVRAAGSLMEQLKASVIQTEKTKSKTIVRKRA